MCVCGCGAGDPHPTPHTHPPPTPSPSPLPNGLRSVVWMRQTAMEQGNEVDRTMNEFEVRVLELLGLMADTHERVAAAQERQADALVSLASRAEGEGGLCVYVQGGHVSPWGG